ncbi:MAG: hypothetical protein ACYTGH_08450 [Planctomycetota bacterium]|jgi:hypothetical protein
MATPMTSREVLEKSVWEITHATAATDILTQLQPLADGSLPMGIDRLLTCHELTSEALRTSPMAPAEWDALSQRDQADYVWQTLFLENSPISEAARGILTTLGMLDHLELDPGHRDLETYRTWFESQDPCTHLNYVLDHANLAAVVIPEDALPNQGERPAWLENDRIHTALDTSVLINSWKDAAEPLKAAGILKKKSCDKKGRTAAAEWLAGRCEDTQAVYLTAALPADFDLAAQTNPVKIFKEVLLATAQEEFIPILLRVPGWAEDDLLSLMMSLSESYPEIEFLIDTEGQCPPRRLYPLVRECPNLTLFGGCRKTSSPKCMTDDNRLFLELLGFSTIPVVSGAETLEQLLCRWAHGRWILGRCLQEEYRRLWRTGWRPTREELERDIARLLNDNFWQLANPFIEEEVIEEEVEVENENEGEDAPAEPELVGEGA